MIKVRAEKYLNDKGATEIIYYIYEYQKLIYTGVVENNNETELNKNIKEKIIDIYGKDYWNDDIKYELTIINF